MCAGSDREGPVPILSVGEEAKTEVIPLEPVDAVTVTSLVDNTLDLLLPDQGPARRCDFGETSTSSRLHSRSLDSVVAEHGFSVELTISRHGTKHRVLFDTGLTPQVLTSNMHRLGVTAGELEAVVLSHGHFDHTGGLEGLVHTLGRRNLPVIIHPEFWSRRRVVVPGRDPFELPTPSKAAMRDAGFEIVEQRRPSFLFNRTLLITGEVDRTTDFEKGLPPHQAWRDGRWEPDPLILDDQAAIMHVRDKGLVVVTGCGHAGIVNILRYARRLTGISQIYAVFGGFHLSGRLFEPVIPRVCDALEEISPAVIAPSHCTGWKAVHALASRFPEAFIQPSVGTRYELSSN